MSFELASQNPVRTTYGHINFTPKKHKRILIIGHARHGKDTVAELLRDLYGYSFESSSMAAARIFLYEDMKDKHGYKSFQECFEDRSNHRKEWYDRISEYNRTDKARLAKKILATSNMYVGMRSSEECDESLRQGLFDLVLGVYNPRKPEESYESFKINLWERADIIVPNAGTLQELERKIRKLQPLLK